MLFGHTFSAGIIPFPLTFVLTDIVNEFYGPSGARRLTFVGLGAAVFVFVVIKLALHLPPSPDVADLRSPSSRRRSARRRASTSRR